MWNLPRPGIKPRFPALSSRLSSTVSPGKSSFHIYPSGYHTPAAAAAAAKSLQSCLTLRDPRDCSLPGSSVHGIFQARVLEWVAISFSNHTPDDSQFSISSSDLFPEIQTRRVNSSPGLTHSPMKPKEINTTSPPLTHENFSCHHFFFLNYFIY